MLSKTAVETPTQSTAPAAEPNSPGAQAEPGASGTPASPAASTPASPAASTREQKNDWFRDAFNARRYGDRSEARSTTGAVAEPDRAATGEQPPVPTSAEGKQETPPASPQQTQPEQRGDTLTLTPQELERQVQSETDRRLAKHQREEAERRKREQRKELRSKDPYAFAQLDAQEEVEAEATQSQLEKAQQFAISSMHAYDASVLDPLMNAVPQTERQKILEAIEPGIPGRGQAASKALKALEQHWTSKGISEARKTLINDSGFVKEVLAKYGGQRYEPEAVAAASAPAPSFSVNGWLRGEADRVRGRSR